MDRSSYRLGFRDRAERRRATHRNTWEGVRGEEMIMRKRKRKRGKSDCDTMGKTDEFRPN